MTGGMKVAVSLPDELGKAADRAARRHRVSRSELYQRALRSWLSREGDDLTARINAALEGLEPLRTSPAAVAQAWKDLEW